MHLRPQLSNIVNLGLFYNFGGNVKAGRGRPKGRSLIYGEEKLWQHSVYFQLRPDATTPMPTTEIGGF